MHSHGPPAPPLYGCQVNIAMDGSRDPLIVGWNP